jgi:hypothetical protein
MIAVAVIGVLLVSVVHFRRFSPYRVRHDLVGNPEVVLSLRGVSIAGRDDGKAAWSFDAERVDVSKGRYRTTVTGIRQGRLYDNGKAVATVTAGRAVYNSLSGNVEVTGGVKVRAAKGFEARAQKALWTGFNQQLICPGKVEFRSTEGKLIGTNLVADLRQSQVTLDKARLSVDIEALDKLEPGTGKSSGKVQ